jgi:hypothetical protein
VVLKLVRILRVVAVEVIVPVVIKFEKCDPEEMKSLSRDDRRFELVPLTDIGPDVIPVDTLTVAAVIEVPSILGATTEPEV